MLAVVGVAVFSVGAVDLVAVADVAAFAVAAGVNPGDDVCVPDKCCSSRFGAENTCLRARNESDTGAARAARLSKASAYRLKARGIC